MQGEEGSGGDPAGSLVEKEGDEEKKGEEEEEEEEEGGAGSDSESFELARLALVEEGQGFHFSKAN